MTTKNSVVMPERRRRKRILTLKNVGVATVALIVVFAAITIRSELRRPTHGDYGRLLGREIQKVEPTPKRVEVVSEATPIADATSVDPMLVAPAAREQYLGPTETAAASVIPDAAAEWQRQRVLDHAAGRGVAIVGDATGVAITTTNEKRPQLSGGIFKP